MEAVLISEMSVYIYESTRRCTAEGYFLLSALRIWNLTAQDTASKTEQHAPSP
jgi:hypothetical protein